MPSLHGDRAHRHGGVGQALRHRQDVGDDAEPVGAERRAEPAEAGDDLVEDQQDAVPVADLAQPLQIAERRHQHAGRSGHRLDDHGGDGVRAVQRDQRFERVGEMRALLAAGRG